MSVPASLTPDQIAGTTLTAGELAEIAFMTGLSATGTLTTLNGWTYNGGLAAQYSDNYSISAGSAHKWGGGAAGTPGSLTYYFDPASGFTIGQIAMYQAAMQLWTDEANVTFTQVTSAAQADMQLYLYGSTTPSVPLDHGAYASPIYTAGTPGATTLPATQSMTVSVETTGGWATLDSLTANGGYGPATLVHELGHVIGLMHAGPYNGNNDEVLQQLSPYDSNLYSTMSYVRPTDNARFSANYLPQNTSYGPQTTSVTPQMLDIIAAQQLYGAPSDTQLTSGGQVFGFNCNITDATNIFFNFAIDVNPVVTIWDSGKNNTLDLSGFSTSSAVNLNAGGFSSVAGMTNNVAIAYGTAIDTAIGGSGDDSFIVNTQSDTIDGGGGSNIAQFSSAYASYVITQNAGAVLVNNGTATDTLTNIQSLVFADQTIAVSGLPALAGTLDWTGGSGDFGTVGNWTNPSGPASVPGPLDLVFFAGPAGTPQSVSGNGGAAQMVFTGSTDITGSLDPTLLTIGQLGTVGSLIVAPGGTMAATNAAIVDGSLTDQGIFTVAETLAVAAGAALSVANGGSATTSSLVLAGGTIGVDSNSRVVVGSGIGGSGTISVLASGTMAGYGDLGQAAGDRISDTGTILAMGGLLSLGTMTPGSVGTLQIGATGTLAVGATNTAIQFLGATGWLVATLAPETDLTYGNVGSFNPGDAILLAGNAGGAFSQPVLTNGDTLTLNQLGATPGAALSLILSADPTNQVFFVVPNGNGTSSLLTATGSLTGSTDASAGVADTARTLEWNPGTTGVGVAGDWNSAGNWQDITGTAAVSTGIAPGSLDTAIISGPDATGTAFQVITGDGNSNELDFSGANAIAGTLTTATLVLDATLLPTTVALIGSASLNSTANASINAALDLASGTSLNVAGTLSVASGGALDDLGGGRAILGGLVLDTGTAAGVALDSVSTLELGTAGTAQAGTLTVDAGATMSGDSNLSAIAVLDNGTIDATGGLLGLGTVSGDGTIAVQQGATVSLSGTASGGNVAASYTINLAAPGTDGNGGAATVQFNGTSGAVFGQVTNFAAGDVLAFDYTVNATPFTVVDLPSLTSEYFDSNFHRLLPPSVSYVADATATEGGTLTVSNGYGANVSVVLVGDYTEGSFGTSLVAGSGLVDVTYSLPAVPTLSVSNKSATQSQMTNLLAAATAMLNAAATVISSSATVLDTSAGTLTTANGVVTVANLALNPVTTAGAAAAYNIATTVPGSASISGAPGGTVITNNASADVTLVGGQGTLGSALYIGSGSASALTANITGGAASVVADGISTLFAGRGNLIGVSGANATVSAATGNENDTMVAATGYLQASPGGGNNLVGTVGDANTAAVTVVSGAAGASANDTVVGAGNSSLVITVSAGASMLTGDVNADGSMSNARINLFAAAGSGQLIVLGGNPVGGVGSGSVTVAAALNTVSGNVFVGGAGGGNVIATGTGNTLVYAGGANDQITANGAGNDFINAGRGNETVNLAPSTGNDTLVGWTGAGGGTVSVAGGAGADVFAFVQSQSGVVGARDIISGVTGNDVLSVSGYGGASYAPVVTTSGGATVVALSDGTQITLQSYASLSSSQFRSV